MTPNDSSEPDHSFKLDPFQIEAQDAVDAGRSVVVAAPTGSGKTVVAEHAIGRALREGKKVFYTTPIKALSNQKFREFCDEFGPDSVGLLTGDNAVRANAPIVIMTTEVLRNMLYSRSSLLDDLGWVVLDEVHYLEDRYRGAVWEEVIIHLDPVVRLVCLSATVSNAAELTEWIRAVRGSTTLVEHFERPVPLDHLYVVGEKGRSKVKVMPTLNNDGKPNTTAMRYDVAGGGRSRSGQRGRRRQWLTPRRGDVVEALDSRDLLPAIYFIFSRAGCEESALQLYRSGMTLTDTDGAAAIRDIVMAHTTELSTPELQALGFDSFLGGAMAGIAPHHAGMVPPFKEAVERCFARGLIKVVFATETLALGINMPARSVVIERLSKFTGESHEMLTPGQYTQLTGRAGRRGIDDHGTACVLWSPWVPFRQVAELARAKSMPLRSAFRPNYNMAANLVRRHDTHEAYRLLDASFAQFQVDRDVVEAELQARKLYAKAEDMRSKIADELGPGEQLDALLAGAKAGPARLRSLEERREVESVFATVSPRDIVRCVDGVVIAVLTTAQRKDGTRLKGVNAEGQPVTLRAASMQAAPAVVGRVDLPDAFDPADATVHKKAGDLLSAEGFDGTKKVKPMSKSDRSALRRRARRADRIFHEAEVLEGSVAGSVGTIRRHFDSILEILGEWGYVEGWALTDRGERLARLFNESDLLTTEAVVSGVFDALPPAELAAAVSCLSFEPRMESDNSAEIPMPSVGEALMHLEQLTAALNTAEMKRGLNETRQPHPGFAALVYKWAQGEDLDSVLSQDELTGGDFVRNVRQVADLSSQIAIIAPNEGTRYSARSAVDALTRGVIDASSAVGDTDAPA